MHREEKQKRKEQLVHTLARGFFLFVLIAALFFSTSIAEPIGPQIIWNATENVTPQSALEYTTAGGSFTTLVLNATMQTPRWKAYVGNVTGALTLDDANYYSIYDWSLTDINGEIYASRNNSIVWSSVQCVQDTTLFAEQAYLNISNTTADSINATFNETVHQGFYVGTQPISNSSCRSLVTYVNGSKQAISESAPFQEILLEDQDNKLVYATILETDTLGFNNRTFDFQMIVPEDQFETVGTPYYFWAEII